jgi:hypothetical protein
MDVGTIGQSALSQLLGSLPRQSGDTNRQTSSGFQVEAATLDLSIRITATNAGEGQVQNVQDLMDKLKQWVHDLFAKNGIEWQDLSPEEAQAKLDAGGNQSPDAVAGRILDFVKGFYDGTPGRAQLLRDAVEKGFHEAEGEFGRKLPDVSYRTMDLVHRGLDELFGTPTGGTAPSSQSSIDLAA